MKIFLVSLLAVFAMSCDTPLASRMVPSFQEVLQPTCKTVAIKDVSGGEITFPLWTPKIDNYSFKQALIKAMQNSNIFRSVLVEPGGDYELYTHINSQDLYQGNTMTVILVVNYRLVDGRSGEEIFKEAIPSEGHSTLWESFWGPVRVKNAEEEAVRNNLQSLVRRLSVVLTK
ncbi:MAG: hypothetical protein HY665_08605 [Chloroflexi bacterium]|nr:hypothetical protein [Chloroflexota bacterium]